MHKYFDMHFFSKTKQKQRSTKQRLLEELDASALLSCGPDAAEATDVQRALDDDGQHGAEHDDHLDGVRPENRFHPALKSGAKRHTGHELKCELFYQVLVFGKLRITFQSLMCSWPMLFDTSM